MAKRKSSTQSASCPTNSSRCAPAERDKYQSYLCSREWNVLKEAVHERAGGRCERCRIFPITAVHHLTYERKYHEELTDLQGSCEQCHKFTHGKSDFDPNAEDSISRYLRSCVFRSWGGSPVPSSALEYGPSGKLTFFITLRDQLIALEGVADKIDDAPSSSSLTCTEVVYGSIFYLDKMVGFNIADLPEDWERWRIDSYRSRLNLFGLSEASCLGMSAGPIEPSSKEEG